MQLRTNLPGSRGLEFLRNAAIRTGVYTGICLSLDAGANGRIAKEFKPARTGQVGPKLHPTLDSPWVTETRIYEGGCAMSTATGALGALSFPTRSTAVTVYQ